MQTITLDHTKIDNNLNNFPVLVVINDTTGDECDGGNSIRFVAGSNSGGTENVTEYNYEIEKWVDGYNRLVWVNVTTIYSDSDTVFNMYYNNSGAGDGQNPTGVWDNNFVMVQHMYDNPDNANTADSTSNNDDGTKKGANEPVESGGKIGNAQDFDGSDDWINTTNGFAITGSNWTLEGWIKADDTNNGQSFFSQKDVTGTGRTLVYIKTGNWYSYFGGVPSDSGVGAGTYWQHVVLQYDQPGDDLYWFVNGTAGNTNLNVGGEATSGVFVVMAHKALGSEWADGKFDECRFSDIIRNSSWIKASFHTQNQTTGFLTIGNEQSAPDPLNITDEYPENNTYLQSLQPTVYFTLTNPSGTPMNYTIYIGNSSANATTFLSNESGVANGTYHYNNYYTATNYSAIYWWRVYANSSDTYLNKTFSFTPIRAGGGVISSGSGSIAIAGGAMLIGVIALAFVFSKRRRKDQ